MVARNARSIKRIELHDRTGVLATIWASHWVGYQTCGQGASHMRSNEPNADHVRAWRNAYEQWINVGC